MLSLCLFLPSQQMTQCLTQLLSNDSVNPSLSSEKGNKQDCNEIWQEANPYQFHQTNSSDELFEFVVSNSEQIDCLIVIDTPEVLPFFNQLYEQGILLPIVIIDSEKKFCQKPEKKLEAATHLYHSAEIRLNSQELTQIPKFIDQAIGQFLYLGPSCSLTNRSVVQLQSNKQEYQPSFLMLQQRRLAEKLKERLGYLGVYYKRNPHYFYRNLSPQGKKELIEELSTSYRGIILLYFSPEAEINQAIDQFVNQAFFADVSLSKILEIHMELMDEFSQQLKLESRNEEILLDYRLTLIDILAHLGEMYRRSIPREDIPFDLLYRID